MNKTRLLEGKTALVTGATSGIGFYTASGLAYQGATVYVTGRSKDRGWEAESRVRMTAGHERVHFIRADASTVGGNQELAKQILAEIGKLEILVNNAGALYNERRETTDGYEATLAMNFVRPFALTSALMSALRSSASARIVNVASAGHAMWKGDPFAHIQFNQSYVGMQAYARAKLLNILWTFALARDWRAMASWQMQPIQGGHGRSRPKALNHFMIAANPAVSRFIGVPKQPYGRLVTEKLEQAARGSFALVRL